MIFPCAHAPLCNVCAVHGRWYVLSLGTLFGDEAVHVTGSFVVHLVQVWPVSSDLEVGKNIVICLQEVGPVK